MMVLSYTIGNYSSYYLTRTEAYVSKKSNDEGEFWKSGKDAYNDSCLKNDVIYKTTFKGDMKQ